MVWESLSKYQTIKINHLLPFMAVCLMKVEFEINYNLRVFILIIINLRIKDYVLISLKYNKITSLKCHKVNFQILMIIIHSQILMKILN